MTHPISIASAFRAGDMLSGEIAPGVELVAEADSQVAELQCLRAENAELRAELDDCGEVLSELRAVIKRLRGELAAAQVERDSARSVGAGERGK
jgi:hypothetical protein